MSLGLGRSGESLFPAGLEVYIYSDANVNCSDFKSDDYEIDVDAEPELDDSADLATVTGTEDREVMVAGIEQLLHMDVDSRAPEIEIVEIGEFPRMNQFHPLIPLGNH